MEPLSRELLILCSKISWSDADCEKFEYLLKCDLNWNEVISFAESHRVTPLLYNHLRKFGLELLAPESRELLEQRYYGDLSKTIFYQTELERILKAFSQAQVDSIILKGAALCNFLYPSLYLRPYDDIDILIKEGDWGKARSLLIELGFKPCVNYSDLPPKLIKNEVFSHLHFFNSERGVDVELQFDLFQLGLRMKTLEDVWKTANMVKLEENYMKVLCPEYQLLQLCVHLNKHGYQRLIWFADIFQLLLELKGKLNWDKIYEIACRENVLSSLYFTLYYVNKVYEGEVVSRHQLEQLKPNFFKCLIWNYYWPSKKVLNFQAERDAPALLFHKQLKLLSSNILLTGRAEEKLLYFLRKIFPSKEYLVNKYRDKGRGSYISYLLFRFKTKLGSRKASLADSAHKEVF
jgi:hypothetical protein